MNSFQESIEKKEKETDTLRSLYKFLLLQICSFKRKEEGAFSEEYVLPQLIVEYLKNNQFNGIMYKSTKFFKDIEASDHMYNLVLFTNYSPHESSIFDNDLLSNFASAGPFDFNSQNKFSFKQLVNKINVLKLNIDKYIDIRMYKDFEYLNNRFKSRRSFKNTEIGRFQNFLISQALEKL